MILPDVNVLVYALRVEAPLHAASRGWLDGVLRDDTRFGISPLALSAAVRIVTNRRVFVEPSSIQQAFDFCDDILGRPNCAIVEPSERHWSIFKRLCHETGILGRGISDVWYAALAIDHGCVWISHDRGFARFPGLVWRLPSV